MFVEDAHKRSCSDGIFANVFYNKVDPQSVLKPES